MFKKTIIRITVPLLLIMISLQAFANRAIDNNITRLLQTKNYSALDNQLSSLQNEFESSYLNEDNVVVATQAFYRANPSLEQLHNEWIEKMPQSAFAYLARGIFYSAMGASSRGEDLIQKTPKTSIQKMDRFYEQALSDIEKAKSINSNLLPIYNTAMRIHIMSGTRGQILEDKNTALKRYPYSLSIRATYFWSLEPRWGGSMEEMSREIDNLKPLYSKNPKLKVLGGYMYSEFGHQALLAGDYSEAIKLFTKALESGDYSQYYALRGDAYSQLHMVPEALSDLEKSIDLWPNNPRSYQLAGGHYGRQQTNFTKAILYLTRAIDSQPNDAWTLNFRGALNLNTGHFNEALADFTKAVELQPTSKEYSQNLEIAKKAAASNPK